MSVAPDTPPIVSIPRTVRRSRPSVRRRADERGVAPRHLHVVREVRPCFAPAGREFAVQEPGSPDVLTPVAIRGSDHAAYAAAHVAVRTADLGTRANPLRLTRRGYVAMWAAVAALGAALVAVAFVSWTSVPAPTERPVGGVVTVQQGDTLWSIAQAVFPNRDPRAEVDKLMTLNHLTGAGVRPGQSLKVQ
jgi:LysM repeat protein